MYHVLTTFNDGETRYYAGEVVSAQNFDASELARFIEYEWVGTESTGAVPAHGVEFTLDIKDGRLGQQTEI